MVSGKRGPPPNVRRAELRRIFRSQGVAEMEIANVVESVLAERACWNAAALGRRLRLSFEIKIRLGIRTIDCIDRARQQVKDFYRERKRERDRRRWRTKTMRRDPKRTSDEVSPRARMLAAVLNGAWVCSRVLIDQMKVPYRREAGRSLGDAALQQAVLRAAKELRDRGLAEEMIAAGTRGGRVRLLRRLTPGHNSSEASGFVVTTCRDDNLASPH